MVEKPPAGRWRTVNFNRVDAKDDVPTEKQRVTSNDRWNSARLEPGRLGERIPSHLLHQIAARLQ